MSNDVVMVAIPKELRDQILGLLACPDEPTPYHMRIVSELRTAPETVSLEGVETRSIKIWQEVGGWKKVDCVLVSDLRRLVAPVQSGGVEELVRTAMNAEAYMKAMGQNCDALSSALANLTTTQSAPSVGSTVVDGEYIQFSEIQRIVEFCIHAIEESQPPETTPWDCVDAIKRKFAHLATTQGKKP